MSTTTAQLREISDDTTTSTCCDTHNGLCTATTNTNNTSNFLSPTVYRDITKQVIRCKLAKRRHLVLPRAIDPTYLDHIFPSILALFQPQTVTYNGGIAKVPQWKISCYLEVLPGGIPTTAPNLALKTVLTPLLERCNEVFLYWYRQQHACNKKGGREASSCERLMTFITRYTPAPGEQALLKVCMMCEWGIVPVAFVRFQNAISIVFFCFGSTRCIVYTHLGVALFIVCMPCLLLLGSAHTHDG